MFTALTVQICLDLEHVHLKAALGLSQKIYFWMEMGRIAENLADDPRPVLVIMESYRAQSFTTLSTFFMKRIECKLHFFRLKTCLYCNWK